MFSAFSEDNYRGITVDSESVNYAEEHFQSKVLEAENKWRRAGMRGVWFRVRTEHSYMIPALIDLGYDFHHAKPGYAMLKNWLPKNEEDNIPEYPYTFVGVGGLVLKKNKVLMVKERFALHQNWKLPGGYVEAGEDLGAAAVREVEEETGIETTDIGVITMRHTHGSPEFSFPSHQCSDLYAVVLLQVKKNQELCRQETEIEDVQWLDIDDVLSCKDILEQNKNFIREGLKLLENTSIIKMQKEIFGHTQRNMSMYKICNKDN